MVPAAAGHPSHPSIHRSAGSLPSSPFASGRPCAGAGGGHRPSRQAPGSGDDALWCVLEMVTRRRAAGIADAAGRATGRLDSARPRPDPTAVVAVTDRPPAKLVVETWVL
jgi:hypothetical protein